MLSSNFVVPRTHNVTRVLGCTHVRFGPFVLSLEWFTRSPSGKPKLSGGYGAGLRTRHLGCRGVGAGGCDALVIENMADVPYLNGAVYPETLVAFTRVVEAIRHISIPKGLQILAGANEQAMALATVCGLDFIRVEGFAYGHVADEGWMDACAGPLLRQRKVLDSSIQIYDDVQKKHAAHTLTSDLTL